MMTEDQKVQLFMSLFKGRSDVYATRFSSRKSGKTGYSPACANEWVAGVCGKPKVKCADCLNRQFLPFDAQVARRHLMGDETIGVYPLLPNDACYFLAVDFDKENWQRDALAFWRSCQEADVPAYLERSRSGNGGHIWIFFESPVSAATARNMGSYLLTLTMESNPDLGFKSYDRLFPNQDQMPQGGFGNLIALPLQGGPRKQGNSVFVDDNLQPYTNQWHVLASMDRMSIKEVTALSELAQTKGRVTGVRLPVTDNEEQPWQLPPSRKSQAKIPAGELPPRVDIVIGNQIYVDRKGLPAPLVNRIVRLAAFQNPEFYRAQAMRMPVYNKPRIISCAELYPNHIGLPRGCAQDLTDLLMELKILPAVTDKRNGGIKAGFDFCGELRADQVDAVSKIMPNDLGVLAASTAFGKTVTAINMIAKRNVNTLILVHRRQLIDQWRAQLSEFLGINESEIGVIGGGKRNPNGRLDIATRQSLYRNHEVNDLVADYGHIVVDECHHVSAVSFEEVLRQCNARFVLGLSATVCRKDGHNPIIFMQCGPVRYRTSNKNEAAKRPFSHKVFVRPTTFEVTPSDYKISDVYAAMVRDDKRNDLIVQDVLAALEQDRSPLILTERNDHIELLYDRLCGLAMNLIVLKGGMGKRRYQDVMEQLGEIPDTEERVILATGKYIGEGFDDPRLDTLFLTMPVS